MSGLLLRAQGTPPRVRVPDLLQGFGFVEGDGVLRSSLWRRLLRVQQVVVEDVHIEGEERSRRSPLQPPGASLWQVQTALLPLPRWRGSAPLASRRPGSARAFIEAEAALVSCLPIGTVK
jgi:hypothetical protein